MAKNFWGYRIDRNNIDFFRKELEEERLRQGWGYNEGQNLKNLTVDQGAKKNLPILQKVKKGDILLIPRLPTWGEVAIVEALDNFDEAYRFEISKEFGDYGHIFPAKLLKSFNRNNSAVSGKIRATIKNQGRFWNINNCKEDIEKILQISNTDLKTAESYEESFCNAVADSFRIAYDKKLFKEKLYEKMTNNFSNEEWDFALVTGLRKYFPYPCEVERTGGTSEKDHGTDILIKLPGLLGFQYLIAIQVKDYSGCISEDPLLQISKADKYPEWNNENCKVIEKVLIITKASKENNTNLENNSYGVKVIFASQLKDLLVSIGQTFLGLDRE